MTMISSFAIPLLHHTWHFSISWPACLKQVKALLDGPSSICFNALFYHLYDTSSLTRFGRLHAHLAINLHYLSTKKSFLCLPTIPWCIGFPRNISIIRLKSSLEQRETYEQRRELHAYIRDINVCFLFYQPFVILVRETKGWMEDTRRWWISLPVVRLSSRPSTFARLPTTTYIPRPC